MSKTASPRPSTAFFCGRAAPSLGPLLIAERIAIETYAEIIRWLGEGDPTSRRLMEKILEKEEEHAEDLSSLLANVK